MTDKPPVYLWMDHLRDEDRYSPSWFELDPAGTQQCWIGECNKGCGRTVISATTAWNAPRDLYACGRCG